MWQFSALARESADQHGGVAESKPIGKANINPIRRITFLNSRLHSFKIKGRDEEQRKRKMEQKLLENFLE